MVLSDRDILKRIKEKSIKVGLVDIKKKIDVSRLINLGKTGAPR